LRGILARTGFERSLLEEDETGPERVENVAELVNAAAAWSEEWGMPPLPDGDDGGTEEGSPIERFLQQAALTTSAEVQEGESGVTLMTLHAAKGLEFPVVAIAGLEEGLFPLSRADTPEALEEERRLCYVGMTRAKDKVLLLHAAARRRGGELRPSLPSRFLEDVPAALVEERVTRPSWSIARETPRRPRGTHRSLVLVGEDEVEAQMVETSDDAPRYRPGERVRHRRFGSGTIRRVEGRGRELKVAVEFDDEGVGVKQLLAVYAGLERDWE
jgi:DNA helicase-2/ATP-dependent DNA helicase PcrA